MHNFQSFTERCQLSYCLGHHFGNTLFIVRLDMPAILPLEVMTRLNYVRMMLLSIDSHQADLFVIQAPVKSPQPLSHTPGEDFALETSFQRRTLWSFLGTRHSATKAGCPSHVTLPLVSRLTAKCSWRRGPYRKETGQDCGRSTRTERHERAVWIGAVRWAGPRIGPRPTSRRSRVRWSW